MYPRAVSDDWVFLFLGAVMSWIGFRRLRLRRRIGLREMERHRWLSRRVPWLYALPWFHHMTRERPAMWQVTWSGLFFLVFGAGFVAYGIVRLAI